MNKKIDDLQWRTSHLAFIACEKILGLFLRFAECSVIITCIDVVGLLQLSDFGLAKLMEREQSRVVTSMRGTPGYLAPEWLLPHAAVTAKTDVYSFGMVLLELISGRENTNFSLGKEQWYFPAWAFKMVGEGRPMELFDKRLPLEELEYFHKEETVRTVHAALLCIQDNPALRPSMSRVVHMLQGHVEPEPLNSNSNTRSQSIPPDPIQPPRRLLCASASSRSDEKVEDLPYSYRQPIIGLSNPARMQMKSPRSVREAAVPPPPAPPPRPQLANWWLPAPRESTLSIEAEMMEELQGINLEGSSESLMPSSSSSNLLALQYPRHDNHQQQPNNINNQVISCSTIKHLRNLIPPGALGGLSSSSSSVGGGGGGGGGGAVAVAAAAAAAAASHGSQKCIPPWLVKGDVILLRGPGGGDYHGVVRDVRSDTKQMRLALLHRVSSESRWSVREEETMWRHWNESIKTLDFWVVLRWSTVAGHGYEKVPVEWTVK
jgi:serine/threonine protein kinase